MDECERIDLLECDVRWQAGETRGVWGKTQQCMCSRFSQGLLTVSLAGLHCKKSLTHFTEPSESIWTGANCLGIMCVCVAKGEAVDLL